ncbi:MAG: hypothetical protein Q4D41_10900 [Prevotellaceae bacterium]|nr:hypothetical protein [Prevotellaceae bacterium]
MKKVTLILEDETYNCMLNEGIRIQGTIGLVNSKVCDFSEHAKRKNRGIKRVSYALPHGKVSVGEENIRLSLYIKLKNLDTVPSDIIYDESSEAGDFVARIMD